MYKLGRQSKSNLIGVKTELVRVVQKAICITECDFSVTEGVRNPARQRYLVEEGSSWTLNSRHLTGDAVDLAPYIDGKARFDDWDGNNIWDYCHMVNDAMQRASEVLDIPIEWSGYWEPKHREGFHFQLPWGYPG